MPLNTAEYRWTPVNTANNAEPLSMAMAAVPCQAQSRRIPLRGGRTDGWSSWGGVPRPLMGLCSSPPASDLH